MTKGEISQWAIQKLAHEPDLASNYNHVRPDLLAYSVVSYVILFRLSACGITILRVLHKSMDYLQPIDT